MEWITLPPEKLYYQPDQAQFLDDRRRRLCKRCKIEFKVQPPDTACPQCGSKPIAGPNNKILRVFDRMTIIAGRRWGKSRTGAIAGAEEACFPNTIGWACAPTNPKLHRYVIPAFQQLIPKEWVLDWNVEFKDLRLKNGSLIHFQTLDDPDQGRGQGLDWLWIDEICELTLKHWEVIAPSLADRQGIAFFTTSPRSYDWVYDELYKPAELGVPGYWACHAKTKENPIMTDEYLARERARMSDVMYRQEYEADFVTFTGAIYGEYLKPKHFIRSVDDIKAFIPEWPSIGQRQVLVGLDTGADHPFGAVKFISTEKGMLVVGEYLERNRSFYQHKAELTRFANSSTTKWAINKNERQPMIELAQPPHSIYCSPAQNDQVAGIERVKSWLMADQLYFYEPNCPKTIRQMKSYRWAENYSPTDGSARKEKVFKKDDELPDCVRYALMTWPLLPKPIEKVIERDISMLPDEMQHAIRRMRRIDSPVEEKPKTFMEEFWV